MPFDYIGEWWKLLTEELDLPGPSNPRRNQMDSTERKENYDELNYRFQYLSLLARPALESVGPELFDVIARHCAKSTTQTDKVLSKLKKPSCTMIYLERCMGQIQRAFLAFDESSNFGDSPYWKPEAEQSDERVCLRELETTLGGIKAEVASASDGFLRKHDKVSFWRRTTPEVDQARDLAASVVLYTVRGVILRNKLFRQVERSPTTFWPEVFGILMPIGPELMARKYQRDLLALHKIVRDDHSRHITQDDCMFYFSEIVGLVARRPVN
ncbi:hypothetical protein EJ08DRAFT_734642 [Tothia fuscella]|uniref:Uncharacterized protein n=1 Tax=Tothia fuscella TaxID=1048955 RepID=A0A9P4NR49_9PEZI|nr:hypothetical protein EJ08DRAFT_734642 [Tothia fuscella]